MGGAPCCQPPAVGLLALTSHNPGSTWLARPHLTQPWQVHIAPPHDAHPAPPHPTPQIKEKKLGTDLLIDQLHNVFSQLSASKVPTAKFEKRLEEVRGHCPLVFCVM